MNYTNTNAPVTANAAVTSNSLGSGSFPPIQKQKITIQTPTSQPPVKKETFFSKLMKNKPVLGVLGILFFAVLVGGVLFINSIIAGRNNVNNGPSRASQAGSCVYTINVPLNSCNGGCSDANDCASGLSCLAGKCMNPNCATDSTCSCATSTPTATPTATPVIYSCNSSCSNDAQCQTSNSAYVCYLNYCRLGTNTASTTCQAAAQVSPTPAVVYNCNGSCTTDAQCQSGNAGYICSRDNGNVCRLASNVSSTSCQSVIYVAPTPLAGCNQTCVSNSDCASSSYVCSDTGAGRKCRLANSVNSDTCSAPAVVYTQPTAQPVATAKPTKPTTLPVSGSNDTIKFIMAGAGAIFLGALSLLVL